jgi:hypothetical protein
VLDPTLARIARWLQVRPWNGPGTDKSRVLESMWAALIFDRELERAQRVADSKATESELER